MAGDSHHSRLVRPQRVQRPRAIEANVLDLSNRWIEGELDVEGVQRLRGTKRDEQLSVVVGCRGLTEVGARRRRSLRPDAGREHCDDDGRSDRTGASTADPWHDGEVITAKAQKCQAFTAWALEESHTIRQPYVHQRGSQYRRNALFSSRDAEFDPARARRAALHSRGRHRGGNPQHARPHEAGAEQDMRALSAKLESLAAGLTPIDELGPQNES